MRLIRKHGCYDRSLREKEKRDEDLIEVIRSKEEHVESLDEEIGSLGTTRDRIRKLDDLDKELKSYFRSKKRRSEGLKVVSRAQEKGLTADTLNVLCGEVCGLQKAISKSRPGLKSKLKKCTDLMEMTTKLQDENKQWKKNIERLENACTSANELMDEYNERIRFLGERIEQATQELLDMERQVANLKQQKGRFVEEIVTLTDCKSTILNVQQEISGLEKQREALVEGIRDLSSYIWMTEWAMDFRRFLFDGKNLRNNGPFLEDLETLLEIKKGNRPYLKVFEGSIEKRLRRMFKMMLSQVCAAENRSG